MSIYISQKFDLKNTVRKIDPNAVKLLVFFEHCKKENLGNTQKSLGLGECTLNKSPNYLLLFMLLHNPGKLLQNIDINFTLVLFCYTLLTHTSLLVWQLIIMAT
uniref:Uncharacterized protein n=1 Tax=Glossina pallidipes TaxID=7398 RepID=A0A1A9ZTV5_GLOPL